MLTNQHVEVDHKLVDMSTSSAESLLAGAMRRLLLAGARFMCAFGVRPFRPLCAFAELLALCEVERNGERDERCGFKRHDAGDNSALTVRSPLAGTGCACGRRLSFAASLRDAAIAPFNVSHAPWDRSLVSYTFCSCSDCASVRNAVQRDGREGAHGLGR